MFPHHAYCVQFYTFKFSINASAVYLSLSFLLMFMAFLPYSSYFVYHTNGVLSPSIGMRRNPALIIRLTSLTDKNFERDRHGESKREKGNLRCQIEKLLEFPTTFSLDLNLSLFGTHLEIS